MQNYLNGYGFIPRHGHLTPVKTKTKYPWESACTSPTTSWDTPQYLPSSQGPKLSRNSRTNSHGGSCKLPCKKKKKKKNLVLVNSDASTCWFQHWTCKLQQNTVWETQKQATVGSQSQLHICDAIWENPLDVAKWHFEKWLEKVRKLIYKNIELLNII